MKLPLHILPILLLLAFSERGSAQSEAIAIPAWMQPYFAEGSTTTLPAGQRGPVKHNTFIGSYRARLSVTDTTDGITQHLNSAPGRTVRAASCNWSFSPACRRV